MGRRRAGRGAAEVLLMIALPLPGALVRRAVGICMTPACDSMQTLIRW